MSLAGSISTDRMTGAMGYPCAIATVTICLGSFVALVATSVLTTWTLRIRGVGLNFLAAVTVAASILVGLTLFLSLFNGYDVGGMVVGQAIVLVASVFLWMAQGRPSPSGARFPAPGEILERVRRHRTVSILLVAALAASSVELVLAVTVVPNTWDSLMYHLSRVALWIQDGGVFHLESGTGYEREYAPNGEITYGWTVLLSDGDRLAALVPWLFSLASGVLVYEGARFLRFDRPPAAFAAANFLLLPQIIVQASSTLIDLQASFFIGVFALFGARALRDRSWSDLVIASLALGLAVGTKGTFLLAVPGLAVIAVAGLRAWSPSTRPLLVGAGVVAAGVLLLGSSQYIVNAVRSGKPQGEVASDARRTSPLPTTMVRTAASFIDLPGMGGTLPAQVTQEVHDRVWPAGSEPFNDTFVSEDGIGFGPLVPLLLFPLLIFYMVRRREAPDRRLIALASASCFVVYAVLFEPAFNTSHVLVTGVLLGAPLMARAGEVPWLRHLAAAVAVFFAVIVLSQNALKPLYPDAAIGLSRYEQQGLQHEFAPALRRADEVIPHDARLAYIGPRGATWDFPFFGPNLDRYVFRIEASVSPSLQEVRAIASEHDLDAVVFAGVDPPSGLRTIRLGDIAFSQHRVWLVGDDGGQ